MTFPLDTPQVFGRDTVLAGISDWVCPVCTWDADVDGAVVYVLAVVLLNAAGANDNGVPTLVMRVNCPRCANTTDTPVGDQPSYGEGVEPTPPEVNAPPPDEGG